jgi:hypothetical protein
MGKLLLQLAGGGREELPYYLEWGPGRGWVGEVVGLGDLPQIKHANPWVKTFLLSFFSFALP